MGGLNFLLLSQAPVPIRLVDAEVVPVATVYLDILVAKTVQALEFTVI